LIRSSWVFFVSHHTERDFHHMSGERYKTDPAHGTLKRYKIGSAQQLLTVLLTASTNVIGLYLRAGENNEER
jgi:hypothetical protein